MIPWDAETDDLWRPWLENVGRRRRHCFACGSNLQLSGSGSGAGEVIEMLRCPVCDLQFDFWVRPSETAHAHVMATATPRFGPKVLLSRASTDLAQPPAATWHMAWIWLGQAVRLVLRERFIEAFGIYSLSYEAILSLAWTLRGDHVPSKTLGQLRLEAVAAGFVDETDAAHLTVFTQLRNDLVHGHWRGWTPLGRAQTHQDLEGRLWAWFSYEDGYINTTLALLKLLPALPHDDPRSVHFTWSV